MAIEKSYIDMIKERDVKIEALRELLKLAHEKPGSQSDMIADIERRLNISDCMVDNLRSVKAEMEAERYLKDERIAELEGKIFKQSQESKEAVSRAIEIILEADAKIAELEKEKAELKSLLEKNISTFINKKEEGILLGLPIFEAYQLEQQAKGVSDFVSSIQGFSEGYIQALKEQE
jgi:hypothetical protein